MNQKRCYDLLAVDLDGTLLDSGGRISAENRAALRRAHEAGIRVVLCTGRAFAETAPVLADLGLALDAAVTSSGAVVSEVADGRTLASLRMPLELAHAVAAWFRERAYPIVWLTDPFESGDDGYVIRGPRTHAALDRWIERTPCRIRLVEALPQDAAAPIRIAVIDDAPRLETLSRDFGAAFAGRATYNVLCAPSYEIRVLETFTASASKWWGVEWLCRRWGLDPARTAAVGDDVNDVELVRRAGLGVAMANAIPAVHAVARATTASNNEHGVARLVDRLLAPDGED